MTKTINILNRTLCLASAFTFAGISQNSLAQSLAVKVARSADAAGAPSESEQKLLRVRPMNTRTIDPTFVSGSRFEQETGVSHFTAIRQAVDLGLKSRKIFTNEIIDRAYGLPGRDRSLPVGLLSHSMCTYDSTSAAYVLGADYVPDATTLTRINNFVNIYNKQRAAALAGKEEGKEKLSLIWSTLFSCLAYAESLADPDESSESDALYLDFLNSNAAMKADFVARGMGTRPKGVLMHADHPGEYYIRKRAIRNDPNLTPAQKEEALRKLDEEYAEWGPNKWMVAGIFQFAPDVSSNAAPCVHQWNETAAEYNRSGMGQINLNKTELTRALVSPLQAFNTYCGAQKMSQGFNSQANTVNLTGVHPANIIGGQNLKAPQDRCMSLLMRGGTGRMYAHFGPLRNSTQRNTAILFNCVERATLPELKN